jgi:hypothetical protein
LAAAVKLTCCDPPAFSVKLAGDAVTPAGTPWTATLIDPEKPFAAAAETVMA